MLKAKGQALAEYVVAGGVVAVVGIGGTLFFGTTFNAYLQDLYNEELMGTTAATANVANGGFAGAPGSTLDPANGPILQNQALIASDGTPIYLDDYPTDLNKALTTTGANGTTNMLLGNLDNVIQQLQASGDLTSEQINILIQLANQGHKIAGIEAGVEAKLKAGGSLTWADAHDIGWGGTTGDPNDPQPADYGEAAAMRALYDQAVASGALGDPKANQAVTILTNQILNIANGVEDAAYAMERGEVTNEAEFNAWVANGLTERDTDLGVNTQQSLTDLGASIVTHDASGNICSVGSGTDSGTSCSG